MVICCRDRIHLVLCLLGILVAHGIAPAPTAIAQNAAGADQQGPAAQGEEKKDEAELFRVDLNTSDAADTMLRITRNLAASGGYADAGERLADVVAAHPRIVSEVSPGLYLPLWRVAVDEVLSWPIEGLQAYQDVVAQQARTQYAEALQQNDLRELERMAQQYFLSDVGDNAAVAVGDRLREDGWPVLALYYYRLVLERHPNSDVPRTDLLLRAALAAREAGLDHLYSLPGEQLEGVALRADPTAGKTAASDWLAGQVRQPARPADPVGGFGNLAPAPVIAPATVTWDIRLAGKPERQTGYWAVATGSSTPPIYPTLSGNVLYAVNLHSAWAIDVRSGITLWRYDSRETQGEALPPVCRTQARQPLVDGGVVYVPLEEPPEEQAGQQQRNMFLMGSPAAETDLYALDAATGRPLWHWSPRAGGMEFGALSVDGQAVATEALVCVALASPSNFFGEVHTAAVDRHSGRLIWAHPLAAYMASLGGARRAWGMTLDVAGTALAVRGGLLLSSGLGVTTAQSCLGGGILWSRVMPDMVLPEGSSQPQWVRRPDPQRRLIEGTVLARRPRVLADRGIVVAGFALSPRLWAYDWIDGRVLWQTDAAGARQPLAIAGGAAIAWGQTVRAFDLATGAPRQEFALWPEPVIGEPVVAADPEGVNAGKVMAPTQAGIRTLDLATGKIELTSALPADVESGNLALTEFGLIIVSESGAVCMHDWETAKGHFLAMAEEDPGDAVPLVTLGAAALRLEKTEEGLDYLDRALARDPADDLRARAYQLYEDFYRIAFANSRTELIDRVLDRLRESATGGSNLCRQAFLRAEHLSRRSPSDAVASIQEVLDDPASRHARVAGPVGPGVSGILAEEAIDRLIASHGRDLYRPWEQAAQASRRKARSAGDYDGLLEVAQRYPNSRASREALDDALCLLLDRKDLNEANRLLIRLVNLTPEGDRETRYRALLADTSLQLGSGEYAQLAASALGRTVPDDTRVPLADGRTATVGEVLRRAAAATSSSPDRGHAEVGVALPPYRTAWKMELSPERRGVQAVQSLPEAPQANGDGGREAMLYLVDIRGVMAVDRKDGRIVWEHNTKSDGNVFRGNRCVIGRTGLYVAGAGSLARIEEATGELLWNIRLQPEGRAPLFAPRESVTGVLRYGDTGWEGGSGVHPSRFDELGDKLIVNTMYNLHVIDPRDGYTVQTIGYPQGVFYGGFIAYGQTAMGIPQRPARMRQRALFYDLATGDFLRELRFGQAVLPSAIAPHGGRWWPMFLQNGQEIFIIDLKTGNVSPTLKLDDANPRFGRRAALADGNVLYRIAPSNQAIEAVDVAQGTTQWAYSPPDEKGFNALMSDGDHLIATWPSGITMLRAADGQKLWEHTMSGEQVANMSVRDVIGPHILAQVNRRSDNRWTSNSALLDKRTGRLVYEFRKPDGQGMVMLHAGPSGILVRLDHQNLEYWVHDPDGS